MGSSRTSRQQLWHMSAPLGRDPVSWSSWGIFVHSLMVLIFAVSLMVLVFVLSLMVLIFLVTLMVLILVLSLMVLILDLSLTVLDFCSQSDGADC